MATVLIAFSTLQPSLFFLLLLCREPSRALLPPRPHNYTGIICAQIFFHRPETHWRSRPKSTPNTTPQNVVRSKNFTAFFQTFFNVFRQKIAKKTAKKNAKKKPKKNGRLTPTREPDGQKSTRLEEQIGKHGISLSGS
jgi:hypothetical protein